MFEIDSILEKENETTSIRMKVERLFEILQNEFDRQPTFSSSLTTDTFDTYEKSSKIYLESIHRHENELEISIGQFHDTGLTRQYHNRLNQIKERINEIELNIKTLLKHLQQGLTEQNILQKKIHTIVEDLDDCERRLTDRMILKEYEVEQKLQVEFQNSSYKQ
jgi:predicted  nucleic acid-binding Zn-ribbon protein